MDDLPAVLAATNYVFQQAGLKEISLDQFRNEFCLPFTGFYERYTPHIPKPTLEEWFHGHFRKVQDDVVELPHARDFLKFCRAHGIRTFLLSTVHPEHYTVQARTTGFGEFIDIPYLGILDKRTKIKDILTENNLLAGETVFIGDMQHDIETAKYGGVYSVGVLTGYNRLEQLRASEPDLICEHLGELREILEQNHFEIIHRPGGQEPAPVSHPICTVGGLIYNTAGEVLMIRTEKWSSLWGIPGGKIKYGEPSTEALRREILEETGLEVDDVRFVMVQDCIHSREFYREAHFLLLNYTCRTNGGTVKLNEEAQEFRWVTMDEALKMELNHPTRILLEAVRNQG